MKSNRIYSWEMETKDGFVLRQYEPDGKENTWKQLNPKDVVRVSFVPVVPILPQHDVLIDISRGERFIKRFARGFLKDDGKGFRLAEYVNCCVTNRYRFWVFSSGKCLVTRPDFEVRI